MKNWGQSFLPTNYSVSEKDGGHSVKSVNREGRIQSNVWGTACGILRSLNSLGWRQGRGWTWLWAWSFLQRTKCLSEDTRVQVDVYLWTRIRVTRPSVLLSRQGGGGGLLEQCLYVCSAALEKRRWWNWYLGAATLSSTYVEIRRSVNYSIKGCLQTQLLAQVVPFSSCPPFRTIVEYYIC